MDDQNEPEFSQSGDRLDARGWQSRQGASSTASGPSGAAAGGATSTNEDVSDLVSDEYKMDHRRRGKAILINNKSFAKQLRLGERKGTDLDATNLYSLFTEMGFETSIEPDCAAQKMKNVISQAARESHWDEDCFLCAILTHGEQGVVYGTDAAVNLDELITPLKTCPSLAGKPKLFFIQACRGSKLDEGQEVVDAKGVPEDEEEENIDTRLVHRIPTEADFLMAFSCVPGYYAWRNSDRGSWFVQALVDVFRKNWDRMDLLSMMTRVCKKVAMDFESNVQRDPGFHRKKQVPCISSMLTRDLHFTPKK